MVVPASNKGPPGDETTLQTSNQANLENNNIRYLTCLDLYDFLQSFPHNPTNNISAIVHSGCSLLSLTSSIKFIDATKKSWLVPLLRVRSHALVFLAKKLDRAKSISGPFFTTCSRCIFNRPATDAAIAS